MGGGAQAASLRPDWNGSGSIPKFRNSRDIRDFGAPNHSGKVPYGTQPAARPVYTHDPSALIAPEEEGDLPPSGLAGARPAREVGASAQKKKKSQDWTPAGEAVQRTCARSRRSRYSPRNAIRSANIFGPEEKPRRGGAAPGGNSTSSPVAVVVWRKALYGRAGRTE